MKTFLFFFYLCILSLALSAQKKNESYQYHIHETTSPIKIDGIADDEGWRDVETAENFFMVLPMDTSRAEIRTEVKMTYDRQNIYLLAICYNGIEGPYMVESLKRDFSSARAPCRSR